MTSAHRFEILCADDPRLASRYDDLAHAEAQLHAAELDHPETEAARRRILDFCTGHRGETTRQPDPSNADGSRIDGSAVARSGADETGIGESGFGESGSGEPNALHRGCLAGHLTGSALVVDAAGERTLLLHHRKLDRWLQPGGHADGDGNLAAVALKEATEETGIEGLRVVVPAVDIDVHAIPARPGEPEHLHLDVRFLVLAPSGAEAAHNHEATDARWATADDPAIVGSSELNRAVTRALAIAQVLTTS